MDPFQPKVPFLFGASYMGYYMIGYLHLPLLIVSVILLILLPIFSRKKGNAFVLITSSLYLSGGSTFFVNYLISIIL